LRWQKVFAKSLYSNSNLVARAYVSGADATGFFGLALTFGASRRTGAAFAATFLRSK
jgi:hypothetical protein